MWGICSFQSVKQERACIGDTWCRQRSEGQEVSHVKSECPLGTQLPLGCRTPIEIMLVFTLGFFTKELKGLWKKKRYLLTSYTVGAKNLAAMSLQNLQQMGTISVYNHLLFFKPSPTFFLFLYTLTAPLPPSLLSHFPYPWASTVPSSFHF